MAVYILEIPYFVVNNPRSGGPLNRTDTLFATTGLTVLNAEGALHHDCIIRSTRSRRNSCNI